MGLLTEPKMALMGAGVSWVPSPQGGPETGGAVCVPNRAVACVPTGRLCWDLAGYFLWPFGKVIQKVEVKACPESGPYREGWLGCPIPNPDTPHLPPRSPNPAGRWVRVKPVRRRLVQERPQPCSVVLSHAAGAHGAGLMSATG